MSDRPRSSRKPLHERTNSESNTQSRPQSPTTIRIIPKTPPRLLGSGSGVLRDDVYSRNPLPTLPSHFLSPQLANSKGTGVAASSSSLSIPAPSLSPVSDEGFQRATAQFSPVSSMRSIGSGQSTLHPASDWGDGTSTGSPGFKTKPPKKKLLHIHKDDKTFSLTKDAPSFPVSPSELSDEGTRSLRSPSSLSSPLLTQHKSSDSLYSPYSNAQDRINSIGSCISSFPASPAHVPATPAGDKNKEDIISADPIDPSPWNYQLVGGLRQVPKTPDQKKSALIEESPLPPLPETSDGSPQVSRSHDLVAKPSFQSTETAGTASTTSENTNYKVYGDTSAATSDGVLAIPGVPDYEIFDKSSAGNSIHQKSSSDGSNYEVYHKSSSEGINYEIHHKSSSEGNNYEIHHKSSDDSFYDTAEKPKSSGSNYVIHHKSSDSSNFKSLEKSSTGNSNYEIIGSPSPTGSVIYRPRTGPASEAETYEDYDEFDNSSSLTSPEFIHPDYNQPTTKFSHESLVIPPLQPRSRPNDGFGYYKSRSRETLRSGSLTSISTVLSQKEAYKAIIASGSVVDLAIIKNKKGKKLQKQRAAEPSSSTWVPAPVLAPARSHMNETPHVWSSQLSTVLSESDGGTDRGSAVSAWSGGRPSSGFPSTQSRHSRQMLSISSSLAAEEAQLAAGRRQSESASLEPPSAAFARTGRHHSQSSIRYVGDQDEYGDGITDMQDLRNRPSRTRLHNSSFSYSASISDPTTRTSTMRSTSTTRSRTNSILVAAIPTWARVYYGSGERRGLIAPGSSILEEDSRANSFRSRSGSPNTDNFPLNIYSPRRRPREGRMLQGDEGRGSMEITPVQDTDVQGRMMQERYSRRLRTWSMSSMWSPHLKHDRRAINRSAWVPPSVTWSSEGGAFGRRNIQVVMFIVGFIFPFAWMIAAFLPLPPNPMNEMREIETSRTSTSNLNGANSNVNEYARHVKPMDEARYESARWWRQLNRIMSFIGLLIIGAVVTLVVVGLHQRWG